MVMVTISQSGVNAQKIRQRKHCGYMTRKLTKLERKKYMRDLRKNMALTKKRKAELRREADYQGSGQMGCTGEDMEELLTEIDDLKAKVRDLEAEKSYMQRPSLDGSCP